MTSIPGWCSICMRNAGMDVDDVDDLLNRRSGLVGLCGVTISGTCTS